MTNLQSTKIHLFFLLFPALSLVSSSDYTLPSQQFINCGSNTDTPFNGRNFIGDENSGEVSFSRSRVTSSSTSPPLYQSARIFDTQSSYELKITDRGTHMVRFHLYPFPSLDNLSDAHFNVSAIGFSLISNFNSPNSTSPVIKEFMFHINVGNLNIEFTPLASSFAFINAIEAFLLPPNLTESFTRGRGDISPGENIDFISHALHTIHRINVGGSDISPDSDNLLRNWVSDSDDYILLPTPAMTTPPSSTPPTYQERGSNVYIAPDLVYMSAKYMNSVSEGDRYFYNITWRFNVTKKATHFVRAHFNDVVSPGLESGNFNFYIYSNFSRSIDPLSFIRTGIATPFYYDFVVDSDDSGVMRISIGQRRDSPDRRPFLNGIEIMEVIKNVNLNGNENENQNQNQNEPKNKKKMVIILGVVLGVVALVFIVAMGLFFLLRFRKAKLVENFDRPLVYLYGESSYGTTTEKNGSPLPNLNLGLKVSFAEMIDATNKFNPKLIIGEGGFGKVYKGTLRSGMRVAVKRSEPGNGQGLPEFQTEIMVLSKIRHRHLVSLIGYCDERNEMILVYEFMEKGTLREHLYNWNKDSMGWEPSSNPLNWNRRLEICIGAAKGIHYLHTSSDGGIIHRDVKSTNILLDEHYVAKVADFGLSRSGPPDHTHVSTEVKGSFGYLDPEYFRCLQLTQKSDVYSFGVVLLEVLCGRPAIDKSLPRDQVNLADWGVLCQRKGELEKIVDPILKGKINSSSLRKFGETVEKCLKESGNKRPTMVDVLWDLEYVLQLQQNGVTREPHEDSTNDASWGQFPLPVIQRFPSHNITVEEEDELNQGTSDVRYTDVSEVFSQLKVDDAR